MKKMTAMLMVTMILPLLYCKQRESSFTVSESDSSAQIDTVGGIIAEKSYQYYKELDSAAKEINQKCPLKFHARFGTSAILLPEGVIDSAAYEDSNKLVMYITFDEDKVFSLPTADGEIKETKKIAEVKTFWDSVWAKGLSARSSFGFDLDQYGNPTVEYRCSNHSGKYLFTCKITSDMYSKLSR